MLALLDSLLTAGFDLEDQGRRALRWLDGPDYKPGDVFDVGGTTAAALHRIRSGAPAAAAGGEEERDNGNRSHRVPRRARYPHHLDPASALQVPGYQRLHITAARSSRRSSVSTGSGTWVTRQLRHATAADAGAPDDRGRAASASARGPRPQLPAAPCACDLAGD